MELKGDGIALRGKARELPCVERQGNRMEKTCGASLWTGKAERREETIKKQEETN